MAQALPLEMARILASLALGARGPFVGTHRWQREATREKLKRPRLLWLQEGPRATGCGRLRGWEGREPPEAGLPTSRPGWGLRAQGLPDNDPVSEPLSRWAFVTAATGAPARARRHAGISDLPALQGVWPGAVTAWPSLGPPS